MLLLRQFAAISRVSNRLYANQKSTINSKMANTGKLVHQELMRHVSPFARINIRSDIFVKIQPADVLDYPNGNAFIAELHGGGNVRNATAAIKVEVKDDDTQVDVDVSKLGNQTDFHCELKVPVRASLNIVGKEGVHVENIFGDNVHIEATKNIHTKELRAPKITLQSESGNINCSGLLLAQDAVLKTKGNGHIILDKLQGNNFNCKTEGGNINTNSCYAEASKFETDSGGLQLKNIHKRSEIYVHKNGNINVTGVNGNVYIRSNGGKINLQLSEISGENIIMGSSIEEAVINISDAIEENSYIEINSSPITLDSSLSHLADCISNDNRVSVCHKSVTMLIN